MSPGAGAPDGTVAVGARLTHRGPLDVGGLRHVGGLMLAAGVLLPALPGHPGLPCPLRAITGVPCPFCGMTTSVEATVHGHLGVAATANPVGILAVVVAVVLLVTRPATVRLPPAWVLGVGVLAMWLFELHRFRLLF